MMTFEEWKAVYKPIKDCYMFETYGVEVAFVKEQNPLTIWTLEDAGEGEFIMNGWHFVNRIGYYITEIPFKENAYIFVDIPSENLDENEKEEID